MGYNTDDLELSSNFKPLEGEANLGPALTREVVGGTHIAPQCITIQGDNFVLVDWMNGLPRHDKPGTRSLRFPHGLLMWGESIDEGVRRLIRNQQGLEVTAIRVVGIHTELDDTPHWHIEPIVLVDVAGVPNPPSDAAIIRLPIGPELPAEHKWAGKPPFATMFEELIGPAIPLLR